jgi:hypothetical protein
MTRTQELLALAERENVSRGKVSLDKYWPVLVALRSKNWTYDAIYEWLVDKGEKLSSRSSFKSAASRRFRRHMDKLSGRHTL